MTMLPENSEFVFLKRVQLNKSQIQPLKMIFKFICAKIILQKKKNIANNFVQKENQFILITIFLLGKLIR